MKQYQLLIFDWDGTLMDSTQQITTCMQSAIKANQLPHRTDHAIHAIIGLGLDEAIRVLFPAISEAEVKNTADAYREYFLFKDKTPSPLFDGVEDVLHQLKHVHGYEMAIATGKSRRGLDKVMDQAQLHEYFPITRTADETFSKPHPLMLEEILVDYNQRKEYALLIGDSIYDMKMAYNAGVDALGVSYGVASKKELLENQALDCIDDIKAIIDWLKTSN